MVLQNVFQDLGEDPKEPCLELELETTWQDCKLQEIERRSRPRNNDESPVNNVNHPTKLVFDFNDIFLFSLCYMRKYYNLKAV